MQLVYVMSTSYSFLTLRIVIVGIRTILRQIFRVLVRACRKIVHEPLLLGDKTITINNNIRGRSQMTSCENRQFLLPSLPSVIIA